MREHGLEENMCYLCRIPRSPGPQCSFPAAAKGNGFAEKLSFSDEATLHVRCQLNRHSVRIWSWTIIVQLWNTSVIHRKGMSFVLFLLAKCMGHFSF
jgi:hypothetical protein